MQLLWDMQSKEVAYSLSSEHSIFKSHRRGSNINVPFLLNSQPFKEDNNHTKLVEEYVPKIVTELSIDNHTKII